MKQRVRSEDARSASVEIGSDRSFGFVFTAVFAIIGLVPLWNGGEVRPWALLASALVLIAAVAMPRVLHRPNVLWSKFGMLLHRVMSPLILSAMFFVIITPLGLLMRASGKDPLRLRRQRDAESYWIMRTPPGPEADSMKQQF
ncbi:MAG: SxtJ family membrane protein [Magnetospirillum sp.]|nr:SxtJ family membrane protein [Magnetospirillum sp.]